MFYTLSIPTVEWYQCLFVEHSWPTFYALLEENPINFIR